MRGRIRPGFEWTVHEPSTAILNRMARRLKSPDCPVSGLVAPGRIELHVGGEEEHLWSPQLIVDVRDEAEGTRLVARFGPHPSVWTLFLAAYAVCTLLGAMSAVFALAQFTLGESPWAIWGVPLSTSLATGLYAGAMFGQGLSKEQMARLEQFLRTSVGSPHVHGHEQNGDQAVA